MRRQGDLIQYDRRVSKAPNLTTPEDNLFSWEQAIRVLRKNGRFALVIAGLLTLAVVIVALSLRDVYQPSARLEIDPLGSGIKTLHEIEDSTPADNLDYLETQVQILQSEALAIRVIRVLELDHNLELVTPADIFQYGGQKTQSSSTSADTYLNEQYELANRTPLESIALANFQKRMSVNPVHNSRLVEVGYASHDPQMAKTVTNTLVTQFIDQNYKNRYTTTMEASVWLSSQLNDLRQKVEQANQAVAAYQKKYDLVEAEDRDVPLSQLMSEVNKQLSEAQANRIEAEAYARMIGSGQTESVPAVREDPVYQNLLTHAADVQAQLAQARAIYGEENSNVKRLSDESAELTKQIDTEKSRMVNRVRSNFASSKTREQMMLKSRDHLRSQMGDASSRMVTYRVLKNEAQASAELYNTLQGRLKEAGIYAGLRSSNIRIVDLAPRLQKPTGPHRRFIVAIGAILSSMLALIAAFVREGLDNTVRTPDDMTQWAGLTSLAMVPTIGERVRPTIWKFLPGAKYAGLTGGKTLFQNPPKMISIGSQPAQFEALSDLRTALMFSRAGSPPRVVLITSSSPSEGKTTVAMNLASVLAQRGKTCLVEADLRKPAVAEAFHVGNTPGLSHLLTGAVSLDEALINVEPIPNLYILPGGTLPPNPADMIASEQMQALIMTLRNEFDHVVIDSPPVINFSDARFLSTLSDTVVLVARYEVTTRRALTRCVQLLQEVHAPVVGAVLNDMDLGSADYHYYNYGFSAIMHRDGNGTRYGIAESVAAAPDASSNGRQL